MNRVKAWVRSFFSLSRRETNAFLILLPLMLLGIFIIPVYQSWQSHQTHDFSNETKALDSALANWRWTNDDSVVSGDPHELFKFNPNFASVQELENLGFPSPLARRIDNYRNKKGKFFIKSDLLKIYGMDSSLYVRLYSYIELPESRKTERIATTIETKSEITPHVLAKFDLNQADTAELIRLYGIGPTLSQRIVNYRNRLGGFTSMEQLHEVYGLDSAVISELEKASFISEEFQPQKIAINEATEKELAAHPYITYNLAKAITTYRFQHGNFQSIEELKKIALVNEAFYTKIKSYLTLNH
jgi:competence protein ComEA